MYCDQCGKPMTSDARFCAHCGAGREEEPPVQQEEPKLRFCGQCGKPVEPHDRFCENCGAGVEESEMPKTISGKPKKKRPVKTETQKASRKKGGWVLIVVLCVSILAGLAVAVPFLGSGSPESKPTVYVDDYFTVEFGGTDGEGYVGIVVNDDAQEELEEVLSELLPEEEFEKLWLALRNGGLLVETDWEQNLSNGDEIELELNVAADILEYAKVEFALRNPTVEVEGLEDAHGAPGNSEMPLQTQPPVTEPPATEAPKATEPPATEPPKATEEPSTEPEDEVTTVYIPGEVNLPVPNSIGNAALADAGETDSGLFYFAYADADEEAMELYRRLCAFCGVYSYLLQQTQESTIYLLLQPGFDYMGVAYYTAEDGVLCVETDDGVNLLLQDGVEGVIAYYMQDLSVPNATTTNILPQFYASVGRLPYMQNQVGGLSYAFDEAMCWTEFYDEVDAASLTKYLSDAMFCGFDVWLDYCEWNQDVMENYIIHLSNGDLEVILAYHAVNEDISVHYEPGVTMYLISGDEYAQAIPRR